MTWTEIEVLLAVLLVIGWAVLTLFITWLTAPKKYKQRVVRVNRQRS